MAELSDAVRSFWGEFTAATGSTADLVDAFAFGDSSEMADELSALVRYGPKRATAGLALELERDGDPVPQPGDHWVVIDGWERPVCVIRTTEVEVKPLREVDAAFAWDEGEGDRSLDWWRRAHDWYFRRVCQRLGVPFSEDLPVVFERFELLWPPVEPPTIGIPAIEH
jgi:uncharacterized protein YhfF